MIRKPSPSYYPDIETFTDAMVAHYTDHLPKPMTIDDYFEGTAKKAAIRDATEIATGEAFDDWVNYIDGCADRYDRGVGASWDN